MVSSQQMKPDQARNECESDADKWKESVKEAAKMDASDSMQGKKEETSFLQLTGVQVKQLAQEAADKMKNAIKKNNNETAPNPDGPIPFKPANDPSFREYTP
ncbi:uncharacterized protein LOC144547688 [Carex rostrata]